jgi:hypothetical protein
MNKFFQWHFKSSQVFYELPVAVPYRELTELKLLAPFVNSFPRTPRKAPSPIVVNACLLLRCLATYFLYLRAFDRRGPYRTHTFPSIVACIRVYKTTHLRLDSQWSLSFWHYYQYPICIPLPPRSCYMPYPSHPPWLDHRNMTVICYIFNSLQLFATVHYRWIGDVLSLMTGYICPSLSLARYTLCELLLLY